MVAVDGVRGRKGVFERKCELVLRVYGQGWL